MLGTGAASSPDPGHPGQKNLFNTLNPPAPVIPGKQSSRLGVIHLMTNLDGSINPVIELA